MKIKFILSIFVLIILTFTLIGNVKLELANQWKFDDEEFLGYVFFTIIDNDNHIVGTFYKIGNRLITPQKIIKIVPRGQGPSELTNIMSLFHYKENIAFVERPEKIKIFTKKKNTYEWKETIWLKRGKRLHIIKNGLFYDNKFFFAGYEVIKSKGTFEKAAFLRVYDHQGIHIKSLIEKTYNSLHQHYLMQKYIAPYNNQVLYVCENELEVTIISAKELGVVRTVSLETPEFYKKMPEDFYIWKKYNKPGQNFTQDVELWATSYSRINKIVVVNNFLVIQLRTCNKHLKRYALLFYNVKNFRLMKTIFIDDYLLGAKKNKFYFHADGDPGRDEEVEDCKINIYQLEYDHEKK